MGSSDVVLACSFCFTQTAPDAARGPARLLAVAAVAIGVLVAVRAFGHRPVRTGLVLVAIGSGALVPLSVVAVNSGRTTVELDASYGLPDGQRWQVTCESAFLDGTNALVSRVSAAGLASCEDATAPTRAMAIGLAGLAAATIVSGFALDIRQRRRRPVVAHAADDPAMGVPGGSGPRSG